MSKIIWIDLWTTNSCVAVMEWATAVVIPNAEWMRTTPSMVALTDSWEKLAWVSAKRQAVTNPKNTIFSSKRFIGHKLSEVKEEASMVPFDIVGWKNDAVMIKMWEKDLRPAEISAMVLAKLKLDAETYLGQKVTKAVITVPAYFDDSQRQATKDAWKIAGLEVERIINEPTAAALAYWIDKQWADKKIAVYDLWWGTFDISILELWDWVFEVLSTNGDTHLGWDNFDEVIINHLIDEFKNQSSIDLKADPMALQRVKEAAEKAKIELSTTNETDINLPFITMDKSWTPQHFTYKLSKQKLEILVEPLVKKTIDPVQKALKDAKLSVWDIDEIILVWWMTRMPSVQKAVEDFFWKESHKWVNPDEVVALWAAIQWWVLTWDVKDVLLLDVIPLSLSIETMWWIATKLIERNTTIPTKKSQVFSTAADSQPSVEINVAQWEREMTTDNKSLWKFILDGIAPAPRWIPQIEVTFDVDANGILNVTAKDKWTWKEQKITIQWSSWMSDEEIEKMRADADSHAEEDKKKKWLAESRNQLDWAIFQAEKLIKDVWDKAEEADKKAVQDAADEAKKTFEKADATKEEYDKAFEVLNEKMQTVGQKLYAATNEGAPAWWAEWAAPSEDAKAEWTDPEAKVKEEADVVDAEVVDDKKKDEPKKDEEKKEDEPKKDEEKKD